MTVLSELPRPARAALIAVVVAVVGFGTLSNAGVVAPQFTRSGSGSGGSDSHQEAWVVLRNVSWRSWQVTAVDVTYEGGGKLDLAAFVGLGDMSPLGFPGTLRTRARTAGLTQLPLAAEPGQDLVVFGSRDGPCTRLLFPDRQPRPPEIAVRISTPLGERTISSPLYIEPCRT